ncbi:PEP-CTERM sorting domain-containing protein, partial [Okeania sp. SIO2B9]|uniref:PEP-CTERM sorting domain-containing protein n=1 Tax=Okeania sp. SIO2B9 TaxID=2607782 RepID=UPI00257E73E5
SFEKSNDSNLTLFPVSSPLDSALLTLTLSPINSGVTTDVTGVVGGKSISIPSIPGIPAVGTTGTVSIDLLDFGFTSAEIINSLDSVTNTIPWFYYDDAVVSFAELELTAESVPEPTNILGLLVTGAIATGIVREKNKKINRLTERSLLLFQ